MNTDPKVSICVPIYCVEDYISRCCDSLFRQSYRNIEYIFVDDFSPDNSIRVLEKAIANYPDRARQVIVVRNQFNQGLAQSRINAICQSTGDYIFHVDSDDWISENAIELLVDKAIKENADIVFGNSYRVYGSGKQIYNLYYNSDKLTFIKALIERRPGVAPVLWNRLISRDLQLKAMPIPNINYSEDWVTFPRLAFYAEKIRKIEYPTYYYFQENKKSYSNTFSVKSKDNLIEASKKLIDFFENKNDGEFAKSIVILKRRITLLLYSTGNRSFCEEVKSEFHDVALLEDIGFRDFIIYCLVKAKLHPVIPVLNKIGIKSKAIIRSFSHSFRH